MILQGIAAAIRNERYIDLAGKYSSSSKFVVVHAKPIDPAGRLWSKPLILRPQTNPQKTWDSVEL